MSEHSFRQACMRWIQTLPSSCAQGHCILCRWDSYAKYWDEMLISISELQVPCL